MVIERHNPRRRNLFAETRLLMEYLRDEYPGRTWHHQFAVGRTPEMVGVQLLDEGERRSARNFNRRVDAIVEPPPDLVVIEATMWRATEKIGRLKEYLFLLPATPEYREWAGAPLVPTILTGQHDPVAEVLCRQLGLRYVYRRPEWIDEFLALYPDRRRRTPHAGMMEALGEG